MKILTEKITLLVRVIVAVVFLLGFHGFSHSMNVQKNGRDSECFSHCDSLIIEMIEFIQPEYKLNKKNRKHIEGRINSFPHKIIRRDTLSHFINTAYAVTYYEFVKHDYKNAKKWSDKFVQTSMPPGFFSYFFNYSSIGLNASNALNEKGKLKTKRDKNSWYTPIKLELSDSLKFDFKRTYIDFLDSFLDDVPVDYSLITYRKILTAYHQGGGRLELLNGYSRKGFIQRCVDAGRSDILNIIFDLWEVGFEDFNRDKNGNLEFRNPTLIVDSVAVSKVYNEILSFDIEVNKSQIDSLIAVRANIDLSPRILRLLSLYFNQSKYKELIEACGRLNNNVTGKNLNTLHNYWALGLTNLGRYEEALHQYDTAIANSTDRRTISTMIMNKACTLGEMGRTEEAVRLFMSQKEYQQNPFEKFVWYDNLGYIYSFYDITTALYYYDAAEKHLDSGYIDLDRRVRHFCRKARVLSHNPFLQRTAIEKAIEYTRRYGCSEVAKGMAYSELAVATSSAYDYIEADRLFRAALQYYENLDDSDLRKIYLIGQYAANLHKLGNTDKAIHLLTAQLGIAKDVYGTQHKEYMTILCNLLQLACAEPNSNIDVEELYRKFSDLKNQSLNDNSRFDFIKSDVAYYVYTGNWQEALIELNKALKIRFNAMQRLLLLEQYESISRAHLDYKEYDNRISSLIPLVKSSMVGGLLTLSGEEERTLLNGPISNIIDGALEKEAYQIALELSLFRKGLLFTKKKAIERKLALKGSLKKATDKLYQKRQQLNNAIAYNDSIHIPELSASVFQLERELAHRLSNNKKLMAELDRTVFHIMEHLSATDLAVEFVRYSDGSNVVYGAFIISRNGMIEFEPLGSEETILSEPQIVWSWLKDYRAKYTCLYFCPDGILNRLGIEYVAFEDQAPLSEMIEVHRVFHLSEIDKNTHGLGKNVVAVGVSDHNSPIGCVESISRGNWTDLPNVEYEMQLINNELQGREIRVYLNDEVTEPNIYLLSGTPISTLHISTHGFYRSSSDLNEAAKNPSSDDYHIARRFLSAGVSEVSGLVLRQGNISWKSPLILEDHDDILTADEIALMVFPNLNLTVLSACESGLGEIDSDGVWGLQRAFRIAGAKSLICSLAKVDDYWTAQFMDAFYEHAAQGNNIYDSFQSAQRWLRRELPDNPEIWSSFILIE